MSHRGVLPTASPKQSRARIRRLLSERRGGVGVVLLLTGAASAAGLSGPAFVGVVVDVVSGDGGDASTITLAAGAYAALTLVAAMLQYVGTIRSAVVGEDALAELRTEVFEHALLVSVDRMEQAGTGDLISRVTGDVTVLARAVRSTLPQVLFAGLEVFLIIVALSLVDVRLAGIALGAGIPVAAAGTWWYLRHAPARYRAEREGHAGLAAGLLQAYRGRRTLVAYGAAGRFRHELAGLGRATVNAELGTTAARNRLRPAVSAGLAAALVGVVAAGAALVDSGAVSIGAVTAAALYVVRLFDPVGILLEQVDEIQQSTAAVARLVGVTQLPQHRVAATASRPATEPSTTAQAAPPSPAASRPAGLPVEVVGVGFGYRPGVPVLHEVTLGVPAGERIVVVGPSGAGKTTLGKLIAGGYRPDSGRITLGGITLDAVDPARIPSLVVMVAQEGHVFRRTIADNVRLARPDASEEEVRRALGFVDALAWVDALPAGTSTVVGAGHHRLRPPQAQQLGLARLVCADPAVVVLDEATADLDPAAAASTERHLIAALAGRTVITIAHRLDAAVRADRVVVMEAGRIVDSGPHADLLARGGTYAALWSHWATDRGLPP